MKLQIGQGDLKEEEKRKGKELKKKNREYGENERGKMENNCDYEKGVFVERIKGFAHWFVWIKM